MLSTTSEVVNCPYCGESIELIIDGSVEHQEYTEDCSVCCQPIVVAVSVDEDDNISVNVHSEQECY